MEDTTNNKSTKEAEEAVTPAKVDNVSDDVNEKTVENADNHDAIDKQLETGDDVIEEVSSEHTLVDSEVSGKGDVSDNVTEEASSELPKNKDAEAESPGDAQENDSRDQKDDKVDDVSDEKAVDAEAKDVVDENINGDVTSSNAAENINGDVTSSNAKPKSEKEENVDNETPVGHNGGGKGLRRRIARREYSTDGQEEDEGDGIYEVRGAFCRMILTFFGVCSLAFYFWICGYLWMIMNKLDTLPRRRAMEPASVIHQENRNPQQM